MPLRAGGWGRQPVLPPGLRTSQDVLRASPSIFPRGLLSLGPFSPATWCGLPIGGTRGGWPGPGTGARRGLPGGRTRSAGPGLPARPGLPAARTPGSGAGRPCQPRPCPPCRAGRGRGAEVGPREDQSPVLPAASGLPAPGRRRRRTARERGPGAAEGPAGSSGTGRAPRAAGRRAGLTGLLRGLGPGGHHAAAAAPGAAGGFRELPGSTRCTSRPSPRRRPPGGGAGRAQRGPG